MKTILVILLALFLHPGNCAEPAKFNPDHGVFLARLSKFSDGSAVKLWPGFKLLAEPILVYFEEDGQSLLVGHPKPPAGFAAVPGAAPAHYSASFPMQLNGSFDTEHPIGGILTNVFILPRAYNTSKELAFMAHEVFHTYQHKKFRANRAQYCDAGAEPLALMFMENYIAAKMLLFPGDDELIREFLTIRRRKYELAPDCKNEDLLELTEGTARYVEMRSLGVNSAGPAGAGDSLRQIREYANAPDGVRHARAYNNGAALCFALESRFPGWQKEIESGRAQWEVLIDKLGGGKDLSALYKKYDFDGFLRRAQADVKTAELGREALLKEINSYGGYKVRLISSQGKMSMNYTASSTRKAGKYTLLELRTVLLADTCQNLSAKNIHLVDDGVSGLVFQIGTLPASIRADDKLISLDSDFSAKVLKAGINGKNFSLSISCGAKIKVKGREITVEVLKDAR